MTKRINATDNVGVVSTKSNGKWGNTMPDMILLPIRVVVFVVGLAIVYFTLESTIQTLIVPRAINNRLTRTYYMFMNWLFRSWIRLSGAVTYERRDRIMAMYAPLVLVTLPFAWLSLVMVGYGLMFWGLGFGSLWESLLVSGSSLLTLGTIVFPEQQRIIVLFMFSEAMMGMILVALLIAYLPTIYSAFSLREQSVSKIETPAGIPPSPVTILTRFQRIGNLEELLDGVWIEWKDWFHSIDESHTSLAVLVFFRSPKPEISWVTAAGVVLDTASLAMSVVDIESDARGALCIRAGYVALRDIADYFGIEHNPDPLPHTPIAISREEFDDVCRQLEAGGVPLKEDRDQAWEDFHGWRVNYETVLLRLAALTMAPYAMWVSDRSMPNLPLRRGEINQITARQNGQLK
jgi:hypothetical protein